jgi:hypothetical protein
MCYPQNHLSVMANYRLLLFVVAYHVFQDSTVLGEQSHSIDKDLDVSLT